MTYLCSKQMTPAHCHDLTGGTYCTQYFPLFPQISCIRSQRQLEGTTRLRQLGVFIRNCVSVVCFNANPPSPLPSPPNDDHLIFPLQWHLVYPLSLGVDLTSLCLSLKSRGEIASSFYSQRVTCFVRASALDGHPLGYKREPTGVVQKTQWSCL